MNRLDHIKLLFRRFYIWLKLALIFFSDASKRLSSFATRHSIKLACFFWFLAVFSIFGWIYGIHSSPWWPYFELSREPVTFIRSENRAEDFRNLLWAISFIGGALAAVIALINALRRTRMMQREQDAEIFAKAVEQLGSEERAVRLGAIYALEGLMRIDFNEPGRDGMMGRQIGETLAAFVRERARRDSEESTHYGTAIDIQSSIIVLSRSWPREKRPPVLKEKGVDLSLSKLDGITLPGGADLYRFNFHNSKIRNSSLNGVKFDGSYLSGVDFSGSHFTKATFKDAFISSCLFFAGERHVVSIDQIQDAYWFIEEPPILEDGVSLPHRGDKKPHGDNSKFDFSVLRRIWF